MVSQINPISSIPAIRLATKITGFQVGSVPAVQHGTTAGHHDVAVHEAGIRQKRKNITNHDRVFVPEQYGLVARIFQLFERGT